MKEPWKTIETDISSVETTLSLCTQSLRSLAILLAPILPSTCTTLWSILNQKGKVHSQLLENAGKLILQPGTLLKESKPLFFKIEINELQNKLKKLREEKLKMKTNETTKLTTKKSDLIPLKDFQKLDIRIGTIITAEKIPKADKLLKLQVNLGTKVGNRQIVAGIATSRKPQDLIGQRIVMIINLEPVSIRGVQSEGMLLAAVDGKKLGLLIPDIEVSNGTRIS